MLIFKRVKDLQFRLKNQKSAGQTIGFIPTMGALHNGHLALVRQAVEAGDLAVVSIFVNPKQFNDPADLLKYPRLPEQDIRMLYAAGCSALFMPPVEEVYPPGVDLEIQLNFKPLDEVMEGVFRPGHFEGMATVVHRLLDIVQPHRIYMGQKDFQQAAIVGNMINQLNLPVELVLCPTVRESSGLAMSSRNLRLSPEMRAIAPVIYQTLEKTRTSFLAGQPADVLERQATNDLLNAGLRPEYFELVDAHNLQPVEQASDSDAIVACTAAWAGEVRLIDNIIVKSNGLLKKS